MGGWYETAYINSGDLDLVEQGFNQIAAQEGYNRIPKPTSLIQRFNDLAFRNPYPGILWGIKLSLGRPDWIVVFPRPRGTLTLYEADGKPPLLARLTALIGCDAFQINVYDGDSIVLLEANAQGEYAFSGGGFSARQAIDNLEELIPDEYYCQERFRLIEVPEKVKEVLRDEDLDDDSRAGQIYVALWDNPEIEDLTPYIRKLYFWRKDVPFPTEVGSSSWVS
jgi:hypothetical protein